MQYIHSFFDQTLERNYKLYQMNARELSNRLKKQYKLSPVMLQLFNSETDLSRNILTIKQLRANGHQINKNDYTVLLVREMIHKIKKNEHVKSMTKQGILLGYELMPIAISSKGDIENPETAIELLDGFKRMMVMEVEDIPDIDILVKVYGEIDDREWINAMILFNSWKLTDDEGARKFMDRGFQLGLYYRYRIMLVNMVLPEWDMFNAIDTYITGRNLSSKWGKGGNTKKTYTTLWNNSVFYDDIQALYDIFTNKPIFTRKKKGKVEEFNSKDNQYRNGGLSRILEIFISILGEIRRYEYTNKIMDRKPFDRKILDDYFSDIDMQKHFVKLIQMSVDGFIVNYITAHMRDDIQKRVYDGMGYEYTPNEKKV